MIVPEPREPYIRCEKVANTSMTNVQDAAEGFCQILMQHASILGSASAEPVEIISAGERIAESAAAYKDAVDERLGEESDLFGGHESNTATAQEVSNSSRSTPQGRSHNSFIIFDKYYLRVEIPENLISFARHYLGQDVATLEDAVRLLCEKDGWNPRVYPNDLITVTGRSISCCIS